MNTKIRNSPLSIVGLVALTITMTFGAAAPSQATEIERYGWTHDSFVTAAVALGASPADAERNWNDPELFLITPVRIETTEITHEGEPLVIDEGSEASQGKLGILAVATTSHKVSSYAPAGNEVFSATLTKQFTYNGISVTAGYASFTTAVAPFTGWYFDSVASSDDYYSVEGGRTNGGHTSQRILIFSYGSGSSNLTIGIKGLWNGGTSKWGS